MARSWKITKVVVASNGSKVSPVVATPASEKRRLGKELWKLREEQQMRVDQHAREMAQMHRDIDRSKSWTLTSRFKSQMPSWW